MLSTARMRERLRSKSVSIGSWLTLGSPNIAEAMAHVGFEFLIIDGEHSSFNLDNIQHMIQAMSATDTLPMVRVPSLDTGIIKLLLDIGAKGIVVPMVSSRQEAVATVQACKYPPEGVRGVGPGRASLFGMHLKDYLGVANEDILVLIIVEHERAISNVKEIVSVPGIDAVFFGYYDYAASIGLQGQIDHPKVLQARSNFLEATRQAGVSAAYATWSSMEAREMRALGFRVITIGSDASFILGTAQRTLEEMRE